MEITFNVPTSLEDIKLRDYQKYIKIAKDNKDEMFLRQKLVQIFCNVPLLAVTGMKRNDFKLVSNAILEVLQQKPKLQPQIEIEDKPFGFIPNINDDIKVGEYVDLDEYMKDWSDMHKAMAVMYRPITRAKKTNYNIEPYEGNEKNSDLMLDLSMDVCIGAVVFFWTLNSQLLTITPKYLQQQLKKNPQMVVALEKSGVGISTFINSLEGACLRLEKLLPYHLAKL